MQRTPILIAALAVIVLVPTRAEAQNPLRRIRQRAEAAANRAVDKAADKVEGRATDAAAGAATDAATGAAAGAATDAAGLPDVGGGRGSSTTVDFRTLQGLLPASFAGYTRGRPSGARNRMMGMETSKAEAPYENGDRSATVTIADMGTLRSWAALGAAWASMDIESETEDGYERTIDYRGHRAYVKQQRSGSGTSSEMAVLVGERFIVTADIDAGDARVAQAALDATDLGALAALAGPKIEPVSNEQMLALLPGSAGGVARAGAEASSGAVLGFTASTATARYGPVTVTITDALGIAGLAGLAWLGGTYSQVTDTGFDRAARYKDLPGREKQERNGADTTSEVSVVVANRFYVTVTGAVALEQTRAVLDAVDLNAIARLAAPPTGGSGN